MNVLSDTLPVYTTTYLISIYIYIIYESYIQIYIQYNNTYYDI